MKLSNIKSILLTSLLVSSAAFATFGETNESAAQSPAATADTSCARSVQDWAQSSAYPVDEVAVGANVYSAAELFSKKAASGTREELAHKLAAVYLNMDSNEVPANVLEASAIIDAWLIETELTKRNAVAPSEKIASIDAYLGSLTVCPS